MYLTEEEELNVTTLEPMWRVNLKFGDWEDGENKDGGRTAAIDIDVPEVHFCVCYYYSSTTIFLRMML